MSRDYRVYLEDILEAIGKIRRYTANLSLRTLSADAKTLDAVVRNLEVVGEAIKKVPDHILEASGCRLEKDRRPARYSHPRLLRNRCRNYLGCCHQ